MLYVLEEVCLGEEFKYRHPESNREDKQRQTSSHESTVQEAGLPHRKGKPTQMPLSISFYLNGLFYVLLFVITNTFILLYSSATVLISSRCVSLHNLLSAYIIVLVCSFSGIHTYILSCFKQIGSQHVYSYESAFLNYQYIREINLKQDYSSNEFTLFSS